MTNKFEGKVIAKTDTELVGEKKKPKFTLVVEEQEGEYPDMLIGTVFGEKNVSQYEYLKVGDMVTVYFNMKGHQDPNNGRWYPSINIWKIETPSSASKEPKEGLPF